ncbi:hypothetical protein SAY87_002066 [Trapa incisa]|uniref:Uncharacterized protein n=1 Tax=Trapa incisa TaxID=236973 RepID=A0AAN7PTF1_9MYRT|nr:hypothetical protein SAY87_002066 [Trapa incisa]
MNVDCKGSRRGWYHCEEWRSWPITPRRGGLLYLKPKLIVIRADNWAKVTDHEMKEKCLTTLWKAFGKQYNTSGLKEGLQKQKKRLTSNREKSNRRNPSRNIGNLLEEILNLRTAIRQKINWDMENNHDDASPSSSCYNENLDKNEDFYYDGQLIMILETFSSKMKKH